MNNEIHSLVDFGSARTTRSTKWRHSTAGILSIHPFIHQTYILAVHASIHEQIFFPSQPLGSSCIPLPQSSREPGQERVYEYKGGLRDLQRQRSLGTRIHLLQM